MEEGGRGAQSSASYALHACRSAERGFEEQIRPLLIDHLVIGAAHIQRRRDTCYYLAQRLSWERLRQDGSVLLRMTASTSPGLL